MSAPLVSVVIPCLNAGKMLRPTLESVVRQTHPALEIVFVDNGSTDGSVEVAEEILGAGARPFRIVACPERGASSARNFGYRFVSGAYVQWLDADDSLDTDKIALQVDALEAAPRADIAYCDFTMRVRLRDGPRNDERRTIGQEGGDQVFFSLAIWRPPHSFLLRRGAADRLTWNQDCPFGEDIEYICTAALMGMRFIHVPGAHAVYHIWSTEQATGRFEHSVDRVRKLEPVFGRLRALAQALPRGAVSERAWTLLDQDWRVWKLPRGSITMSKIDGRRVRLQQHATGRSLELRPREADVVNAVIDVGLGFPTHWFAQRIAKPPATDDFVFIVRTVQKLARAGMMVEVTQSEKGEANANPI